MWVDAYLGGLMGWSVKFGHYSGICNKILDWQYCHYMPGQEELQQLACGGWIYKHWHRWLLYMLVYVNPATQNTP